MFYAVPLKIAVDPAIISPASLALLPVLFYANMPIHEFGHIAACRNSGLKHGGVGFGFYFIMPVMYADITNIWLTNKERRIIANMGGIFSELLYASVLVIIYLLTQNPVFYIAGLSIALFVAWEFNPFVRFDGYWILSDLTNTPNLLQKSKTLLVKTFESLWQKETEPFNVKEVWLLLYGVINTSFLFLFMGFMAYSFHKEIIAFPTTIYGIFSKWLNQNWDISQLNRQLFIVLTFYILIFKLMFQHLLKTFRSWRNRATQETTG
jgi:putative peptide zinc metalloprotease protein